MVRGAKQLGINNGHGGGARNVRRSALIALIGSIVLHAVVLGFVVGLGWSAEATKLDEPLERVFVSFDQPAPPPPPLPTPPPNPIDPAREAGDGLNELPGAVRARADRSGDLAEMLESFGLDDLIAPIDLATELLGGGGGELLDEPTRPEQTLDMLGGGMPDIGFAGLGASNARSVVYVVDASGPMVGTLPIVVDELERSVLALDPAQEFQVVFVNGGSGGAGFTVAPSSGGLIRALPGEVRRVVRWCRMVRAQGRSDPVPALERAMAMRPDAVFLFSRVSTYIGSYEQDREGRLAQVRSRVLSRLDQVNPRSPETGRRRTAIKVVQFHEQDPSGLFRAIAREHGGGLGEVDAYRFITREDGSLR